MPPSQQASQMAMRMRRDSRRKCAFIRSSGTAAAGAAACQAMPSSSQKGSSVIGDLPWVGEVFLGPRQADRNGVGGDAQRGGDLAWAEAFERQGDDLARNQRQLAHGSEQASLPVLRDGAAAPGSSPEARQSCHRPRPLSARARPSPRGLPRGCRRCGRRSCAASCRRGTRAARATRRTRCPAPALRPGAAALRGWRRCGRSSVHARARRHRMGAPRSRLSDRPSTVREHSPCARRFLSAARPFRRSRRAARGRPCASPPRGSPGRTPRRAPARARTGTRISAATTPRGGTSASDAEALRGQAAGLGAGGDPAGGAAAHVQRIALGRVGQQHRDDAR